MTYEPMANEQQTGTENTNIPAVIDLTAPGNGVGDATSAAIAESYTSKINAMIEHGRFDLVADLEEAYARELRGAAA